METAATNLTLWTLLTNIVPYLLTALATVLAWEARRITQQLESIATALHQLELSWTTKLGLLDTRVTTLETLQALQHPNPGAQPQPQNPFIRAAPHHPPDDK